MSDEIANPAGLYTALAKAQAGFQAIGKNREGQDGNRKFKYADLDELIQKTRPALAENGLCVIQLIRSRPEGGQELVTILAHETGATIESTMKLGGEVESIKQYGALLTFFRRYAYQGILCISADDDLDDNPDAGHGTQAGETPRREDGQAEFYSAADFTKNMPDWRKAVTDKKTTPERIVAMVESKAPLTDDQRAAILALAPVASTQE